MCCLDCAHWRFTKIHGFAQCRMSSSSTSVRSSVLLFLPFPPPFRASCLSSSLLVFFLKVDVPLIAIGVVETISQRVRSGRLVATYRARELRILRTLIEFLGFHCLDLFLRFFLFPSAIAAFACGTTESLSIALWSP